jgi:nitrogen fixation protein FixH
MTRTLWITLAVVALVIAVALVLFWFNTDINTGQVVENALGR